MNLLKYYTQKTALYVHIHGDIDTDLFKLFRVEMMPAIRQGKYKKVILCMNSQGGCTVMARAVYRLLNELKESGIAIEALNEYEVSSAAIVVYLAADKRYCLPEADFGVHQGFMTEDCFKGENREDNMKWRMKQHSESEKLDNIIYAERGFKLLNKDRAAYKQGKTLTLTASQAKKRGLVTRII